MQLIFFFKSSALFKRLSHSHHILYNLRIIQPYVSFIILFLIIGGCDSNQIWIDKTKTFELLYEEGKFIQAKVIAEEALQIAREGYKDDNLNIISSHINLGKACVANGDLRAGQENYSIARKIIETEYNNDHWLYAVISNQLGMLQYLQGDYKKALEHLDSAHQYWISNEVLNSKDYTETLETIAHVKYLTNDLAKAEEYYRKSLDVRQKHLVNRQNEIAQCMNNLAAILRIMGNLIESERYTIQSLEIWGNIYGDNHEKIGIGLNNLGVLYKYQGRYNEADSVLSKAVLINENNLGFNHPDLAPDYNNMAQLYHTMGRKKEADKYFTKAIDILIQYDEYNYECGQVLANKAEFYFQTGDYKNAMECITKSIQLISKSEVQHKLPIIKKLEERRTQIELIMSYK